MSVQVTTLESGLRVVTERNPAVETASLGLWIDVGARIETEAQGGIAHMLEHMVFKGTATRSAQDIATEVEDVGGHVNAYTGREQTAYYAKVLKDDVALAVDVTTDLVFAAALDPEELERERTVILQEIGQAHDTPDDIIFDHVQAAAFPHQGIGRPVLGTPQTVSTISRAALAEFRDRHYRPAHCVFAAAGNLEHDRVVEEVARRVAERARSGSGTAAAATPEAATYVGGFYNEVRELEQAHLVIGYPGAAFADPRIYATSVYATLLGGGMSSRLFQEVREKRGLVYSIYAFTQSFSDNGLFAIYAGTSPDDADECFSVIGEELVKVVRDLDDAEIARARAQLKSSILMSLESTSARCEQLAQQIMVFGHPLPVEEVVAKIDAVDRAAVLAVAEAVNAAVPTVAMIGPGGGAEHAERFARRAA
ncbi:MAG: pitrilysin family protein [Alphaproteobacteria bacterium]